MSELDLGPLDRALAQLQTSLAYCASPEARQDPKLAEVFRSAAIQCFEFTFELSGKVLRRFLMTTALSAGPVQELSFPDLIRKGYARGVVSREWEHWNDFRRMRNLTGHTYSESRAAEVFAKIPDFADEIEKMLAAMREELSHDRH